MHRQEWEGQRLAVISPVFNDWGCARDLVSSLAATAHNLPPMRIYLINDGSTDIPDFSREEWRSAFIGLSIIHTGANLGHQRAIAVGLAAAVQDDENDILAVIDADGEDDPADMGKLLGSLAQDSNAVVVAKRQERSETFRFRLFYRIYRLLFRVLTGRPLDFGNYCVMRRAAAERLLYMPELWNHFPATLMRSRLQIHKVPLTRKPRYHGSSRMNFVSLVNHGLAAVAAFSDVVFARLLIAVSALSALVLAAGATVVSIRFASSLAIPGWATAASGFVVLALFQLLALLALMTFIQLSTRSNIPPTPRVAASQYTKSMTEVLRP